MKASRSIVNSRREKILETVRGNGNVAVNELAEQLKVSPLTIRRDLQYLEDHKLLERFYGGARISSDTQEVRNQSKKNYTERKKLRNMRQVWWKMETVFLSTPALQPWRW